MSDFPSSSLEASLTRLGIRWQHVTSAFHTHHFLELEVGIHRPAPILREVISSISLLPLQFIYYYFIWLKGQEFKLLLHPFLILYVKENLWLGGELKN